MKGWIAGILLSLGFLPVFAQDDYSPADRQCNLLRELVYQMQQQEFERLTDISLHQSSGAQQDGSWTFSQQQYAIAEGWEWQGAVNTTLENGYDKRVGAETMRWQYLAHFKTEITGEAALRQLDNIAAQINACVLPQTDSGFAELRRVPREDMEELLPDNYLEAYVYRLPSSNREDVQMNLMVALERLRRGWRPVLILEWVNQKSS